MPGNTIILIKHETTSLIREALIAAIKDRDHPRFVELLKAYKSLMEANKNFIEANNHLSNVKELSKGKIDLEFKLTPDIVKAKLPTEDRSLLYLATFYGEIKFVSSLLEWGMDNDVICDALHLAAKRSSVEMLKLLLSAGKNIADSEKKREKTSLYFTLEKPDLAKALLLIDTNKDLVNIPNREDGNLPIHAVIENTEIEPCEKISLMQALKNAGANLNAKASHQNTVAHLLTMWASKLLPELQTLGVSFEEENEYKRRPIHIAAEEEDLHAIDFLKTQAKIDLNVQDQYGLTALNIAVGKGNIEAAKALITPENINLPDKNGLTPLHTAAGIGNLELVNLLCEHDANVRALDCDGYMPLHITVNISRQHQTRYGQYVFGYRAPSYGLLPAIPIKINEEDDEEEEDIQDTTFRNDNNAFHKAQKEYVDVLKRLLEVDRNMNETVNQPTHEPMMPLLLAAESNNPQAIRLLLKAGANIAARGSNNLTPLHCAASSNYPEQTPGEAIMALTAAGAFPFKANCVVRLPVANDIGSANELNLEFADELRSLLGVKDPNISALFCKTNLGHSEWIQHHPKVLETFFKQLKIFSQEGIPSLFNKEEFAKTFRSFLADMDSKKPGNYWSQKFEEALKVKNTHSVEAEVLADGVQQQLMKKQKRVSFFFPHGQSLGDEEKLDMDCDSDNDSSSSCDI